MESFDKWMKGHQPEWRRTHIESQEWGLWRKRPYPWILPTRLWEEGLWPGIRCGPDNSLPAYLKRTRAQKHRDAHHLNSSWILCANLYFPFRTSSYSRGLFAAFLKNYVASEVDSLEAVELEYAESGVLHPLPALGELCLPSTRQEDRRRKRTDSRCHTLQRPTSAVSAEDPVLGVRDGLQGKTQTR